MLHILVNSNILAKFIYNIFFKKVSVLSFPCRPTSLSRCLNSFLASSRPPAKSTDLRPPPSNHRRAQRLHLLLYHHLSPPNLAAIHHTVGEAPVPSRRSPPTRARQARTPSVLKNLTFRTATRSSKHNFDLLSL
jgi:hypothetical protein